MFDRLHLGDGVLEEQEAAVVDAGQSGPEPAGKSLRLVLVADGVGDLLPLDAERGVGDGVDDVEAGVAVLGEAVAVGDVGGVLALEHHVRAADGVGLGVELLAVDVETGALVVVAR